MASNRDLLPATARQFSKQSYWEQFFGKRGAAAFEWYGEWKDLHEHVEPHLSASSRVLVIGCGNSDFSEQMWANGHRHLLSIDYSATVIKQMRAKSLARHGGKQPEGLRYEEMDLHDIKAPDGAFDVIMDKACLDALVTDPSLAVFRDVSAMIDETLRVLAADGGKYICVTLAQTHVLKFLLTKFAVGWEGVVTQAVSVEAQASLSSFVFVFTRAPAELAAAPTTLTVDLDETDSIFGAEGRKKQGEGRDVAFVELGLEDRSHRRGGGGKRGGAFRFGGGMRPPLSAGAAAAAAAGGGAGGDGDSDDGVGTVRLAAFEKVAARLDGARKMLYAQKELKQLQFSGGVRHSAQIFAGDTAASTGGSFSGAGGSGARIPRYEVSVVDRAGGPADGSPSVAVLLVHPSRFQDFEFAKEEGQQQVADSTGYGRLVFVRLHPAHEFDLANGMAAVQGELGSLVAPLFPTISTKKREKVPYLAVGEDEDPSRVRVSQLSSPASGDIIIEECDDPASDREPPPRLRQLIFLAQLGTVQTEMRLVKAKRRNNNNDKGKARQLQAVDHSYLAFELHRIMVAGLSLVAPALRSVPGTSAAGTSDGGGGGGGGGGASAGTPTAVPSPPQQHPRHRMLVLGLGGGSLVMFLRRHFDAHVQVVELDSAVVQTARDFFGFDDSDGQTEVFIQDGMEFVQKQARGIADASGEGAAPAPQHQRAVFVDVDAKDSTTGIMFPPQSFLTREFLETLYAVLHPDGGLLVLNFACRSPSLYEATIGRMKDVFDAVFEVLVSKEDCNVVVFGLRGGGGTAAEGVPCTAAAAERFLQQHRPTEDGTSPALRAVARGTPWALDLRLGAYVARIQTQVGGAFGIVTADMLGGAAAASGPTASDTGGGGGKAGGRKKPNSKKQKQKGKKKKKK